MTSNRISQLVVTLGLLAPSPAEAGWTVHRASAVCHGVDDNGEAIDPEFAKSSNLQSDSTAAMRLFCRIDEVDRCRRP
jgi:hypothetical protein